MYGHRYRREYNITETREKILETLKEMHLKGFITRANYMCCSSCASMGIWSKIEEKITKSLNKIMLNELPIKPVEISKLILPQGVVYWHHQDEEGFRKRGEICLRFGNPRPYQYEELEFGLSTEEVGRTLYNTLLSKGLSVDWDGNPNRCVIVACPERVIEEAEKARLAIEKFFENVPYPITEEKALPSAPPTTILPSPPPPPTPTATPAPAPTPESNEDAPKHIPIKKPFCPLVGEDGNAFAILGRASRALKREGLHDAAKEMLARATKGDYNNLLCVVMEYVEDNECEEEDA